MIRTDPARIGIIGTGQVASRHLTPAVNKLEDGVLWSVCSRSQERADEFAHEHGAQMAYSDFDTFLEDPDLDAVIIATPDEHHAEQAIRAMLAGKHVFIEKPMATSVFDARMICEAQRKSNRVVRVGYHLRYHRGHKAIQDQLVLSCHGRLRHIRMDWVYNMTPEDCPWRFNPHRHPDNPWGVLGALGTHVMDLAQFLIARGQDATDHLYFQATTQQHLRSHTPTHALLTAKVREGLVECYVALEGRRRRRIEIELEHAFIVCEDTLGAHGGGTITLNDKQIEFETVDPYKEELVDFARSVRTFPGQDYGLHNYDAERRTRSAHDGLGLVRQLTKLW